MQEVKENKLLKKAVGRLFDERKDFIIIGLTGRTGSGCSTVGRLLTQPFANLAASIPEERETYKQRQYYHVYKYAQENWEPFTLIEMKYVLLSFILENDYNTFKIYLSKNFGKYDICYLDSLKKYYDKMHKERQSIYSLIDKDRKKKSEVYLFSDKVYNFYFKEIKRFGDIFYKEIRKLDANAYTEILKEIGNNIRASGEAFKKGIKPENIFKLSQRTNLLIKILRRRNIKTNGRVLVVIDALRNPYEATFFKERYSAFYLMSINTTQKDREERLFGKGLDKEKIENIDDDEFPKQGNNIEDFYNINIEKTVSLADVHLKNINIDKVKKQLVRYISLIMHPGLVTPTNLERCMQIAFNAKLNSGCLSRQVGAVVTDKEYMIRSVGWNNPPNNQIPCNLRNIESLINDELEDKYGLSEYERTEAEFINLIKETLDNGEKLHNLKGRVCSYCFKDAYNGIKNNKNQVHTRSIHAEEMAFLEIARSGGSSLNNGYLFVTASPCELCSKKAYHIGISRIYYIDQYPGISQKHIINCGNRKIKVKLFHGAIGRAYNQFYTQTIPYKDELEMLIGLKFESVENEEN